jgi:hypothetical protein
MGPLGRPEREFDGSTGMAVGATELIFVKGEIVKTFAGLAVGILIACGAPAASAQLRDGKVLLAAMHTRYEQSWYRTVTFEEQAVTRNPDGTHKTETWWEALIVPGKLAIHIGAPESGTGHLFNDGTLTTFRDGKIASTRPFVHMLLVLGFDVYRQPPETTIKECTDQGIDLNKIHEEMWLGREVYVVGADRGDLKSKQFWVEKQRLLFVRLLQPDQTDPKKMDDYRFGDYVRVGGGWIAARVDFYTGGMDNFYETYSDIKGNPKLDPARFTTQGFIKH